MNGTRKYEIDMCSGPIMGKVILFALPLMASSLLQLLFNAADVAVVGHYAGTTALAAVGSTGSLTTLIINVLMGLSIGTNVLVARYYGAGKEKDANETVHTSIAVSLFGGILIGLVGMLLCRPMLEIMGSPEDVIDQSTLYMRIYFAGFPVIAVYNFGSAILRAVGDTRRPLYFLMVAGVVNVALNLVCVIKLKMGVAGVAVPTVISQAISAALVLRCLMHNQGCTRLELKKVRISWPRLREIIRIGLPAGIQSSVFSISNVIIQSSVNSFGSTVMAGNSAGVNLEGFVYVTMIAIYQSALTFTSQNIGAKRFDRVLRILFTCLFLVTLLGAGLGIPAYLFGGTLLKLYNGDPEVIRYGLTRMMYLCAPYFLCGWMDVMVGMIRGMGHSLAPMLVSISGVCGIRLVWLFTVFASHHTLETLYISYPISWAVTASVHLCCFICFYRKLLRTESPPRLAE